MESSEISMTFNFDLGRLREELLGGKGLMFIWRDYSMHLGQN
jgi:hypothetical protein